MEQLRKVYVLQVHFVRIAKGSAELMCGAARPRNHNYLCFWMCSDEHSMFHQNALHAADENGGI